MKKSHKNRDRDRSRDRGNDRRDRYNDHDDYRRYEKKARNGDNRKISKKSDIIQVSSEDEDGDAVQIVNKSEDSFSKLEIPEDDSDEEAIIERRRKERQKLLEKLESKKPAKSKTFEKISASTEIQDDREDEDDDIIDGHVEPQPQKLVTQVIIEFFPFSEKSVKLQKSEKDYCLLFILSRFFQ